MLLSFVVAMVGVMGFTSRAQDLPTITFGYCADDLKSIVGPRKINTYVGGAMKFDAETAQIFKGDKIIKMKIGLGKIYRQTAVTFFISKELGADPIYTQEVPTWSDAWKEFSLNIPFEITGETFYLGYYLRTLSDSDLPLAYDGNKANAQEGSAYYTADNYSISDMMKKWEAVNADYGNICIRCIIEGEDLPEESMDILDISTIDTTPLNTAIPVDIKVRNTGTKVVNSYEFEVTVGTQEPQVFTVDNVNIDNYEENTYSFEVEAKEPGYQLPISAKMLKANGNSLPLPSKAETAVMASDDLQPRVVVVEEITGTWCGWCPRGYVGMEEMKHKYGDVGNYIGIAVHSGDPMEVRGYSTYAVAAAGGNFPAAMVNRMYGIDPRFSTLEQYYNMMKEEKVEASMDMTVDYANNERTKVNAEVTTTFVFDFDQASYGICLITLEDGLGPYMQSNYYSKNNADGYLEGFSGQADYVSLMYNEIPTYINNYTGGVASVPAKIKAGNPNVYKGSVGVNPKNLTNTTIVALLVNRETGHVVTGCKSELRKHAGVDNVAAEVSANVVAKDGMIVVDNSNETTFVYGLNGMKAGEIQGNGSLMLEKGIYIVKVGDKVMKVAL